jgi:hypothetical protein
MVSVNGAKMEQKNLLRSDSSPSPFHDGIVDSLEVERLKKLINCVEDCPWGALSRSVQESLHGLDGLNRLASAITIVLIDQGGTTPDDTSARIMQAAPELYREFGYSRVTALCEEIQYSEIPEQSRVFQELLEAFNRQYFGRALPEYKILAVYDSGLGRRSDADTSHGSDLALKPRGSSISRGSRSTFGTSPTTPAW